jgi:hypothetical protein
LIVSFFTAGPATRPPSDYIKVLRRNIEQRQKQQQKSQQQQQQQPRIYPTLATAITTRMVTATKFPGNQYITEVAATELVVRGTRPIYMNAISTTDETLSSTVRTYTTTNENDSSSNGNNDTDRIVGYQFRHDPRLQLPSIQYCTVEQVQSIYTNLQHCPVLLVLAQDGMPLDQRTNEERTVQEQWLQQSNVRHVTLPGSHHFHADPETADAVVRNVANFLVEQQQQQQPITLPES